ncbi:hypothetical protein [Tolumonas osonensis]|uniref:Uncharacterized protein n=1 Tax=Tolumonas osonensis TaxID=675874 RepID=A0A841G738_9GAMM|nr:hypothetical protein [Tolumonas osonensis]MBB6054728.1 hypothetical protein [Tolumonas osonensis]NCB34220.1 hypothetical protein [Erysipelotrichia bacterium]
MELHNKAGDVTKLADDLTLEEVEEMGFTIDLCDTKFDPNEHWVANEDDQVHQEKKSRSGSNQK